jgi:hypothetical protein
MTVDWHCGSLQGTACRWLLIFDNADSLDVLKYGWPGGCSGSILVTTRDLTAGFSLAAQGMQIHPFDDDSGASAFLSLVGQDLSDEHSKELARAISKELGGLPLALSQMSGFIVQHKLSLEKFLPLYKRNQAKLHKKKAGASDYDHDLGTVWKMALSNLTGHAATLQRLLAFLDPVRIHESILVSAAEGLCGDIDDHELAFLTDEME